MKVACLVLLIAAAGLGCDTSSATAIAGLGVGCAPSTVRVSPASFSMVVGDSAHVTATPPSGCGVALPVPFSVFWRSSNTAVVSVDSLGGTVRALAAGQATVIALVVNDTLVKGAAVVNVTAR